MKIDKFGLKIIVDFIAGITICVGATAAYIKMEKDYMEKRAAEIEKEKKEKEKALIEKRTKELEYLEGRSAWLDKQNGPDDEDDDTDEDEEDDDEYCDSSEEEYQKEMIDLARKAQQYEEDGDDDAVESVLWTARHKAFWH